MHGLAVDRSLRDKVAVLANNSVVDAVQHEDERAQCNAAQKHAVDERVHDNFSAEQLLALRWWIEHNLLVRGFDT